MATQQPIHIMGAGLSGLVLGRCLKHKGIPAIIFEKGTQALRHNYGITLHPWAYQPLLQILNVDESKLRQLVAVDGSGRKYSSLRAHCGRLEGLLREGLDIKWSHRLEGVKTAASGMVLEFQEQPPLPTAFVVDASGVHSRIRKALLPATQVKVLPVVCFRGTRLIKLRDFKDQYESSFRDSNVIDMKRGDALLQISINDYKSGEDGVDISYIYSRPARTEEDPLHKPGRENSGASIIPEELFTELAGLTDLKSPFKQAFAVEQVRKDRILNWLMRSSLLPISGLKEELDVGVVFLGDAAHAMPILGGEGANWALRDGVELADYISANGVAASIRGFYESRYESWKCEVIESERRLSDMHTVERSSL